MGYTLSIGEAKPVYPTTKDAPDGSFDWEVPKVFHPEAPQFTDCPGVNERSPAYTVWEHFAETMGLGDLFTYAKRGSPGHLIPVHPGIAPLHPWHLERFEQARAAFMLRHPEAVPRLSQVPMAPGAVYDDVGEYDAHLVRLDWLIWWSRWALANCQHPAFANR